jgi:hypothetical protein
MARLSLPAVDDVATCAVPARAAQQGGEESSRRLPVQVFTVPKDVAKKLYTDDMLEVVSMLRGFQQGADGTAWTATATSPSRPRTSTSPSCK